MSYKCEVLCDGAWTANSLRFATEAEAREYGNELLSRWMMPEASRAVESTDAVNYVFAEGRASPLGATDASRS